MDMQKQEAIDQAKSILKGGAATSEALLLLANQLVDVKEFAWARKLLDLAVKQGIDNQQLNQDVAQTRAMATFNDNQLNRELALDLARDILDAAFNLKTTRNQKTLQLAGAISQRKWEVTGVIVNLEQAFDYFQRGYQLGVASDDGLTAINAAFVLDLLASLEHTRWGAANTIYARRNDAQDIRTAVIDHLAEKLKPLLPNQPDKNDLPVIARLAEAYFGVERYQDAGIWLAKISQINELADWEIADIARRLIYLLKNQTDPDTSDEAFESTPGWQVLHEFIGDKAHALRSMFRGKVGLALSGGGFRASLYHLGVFAKLAELDMLRHIEVLSCVSGGSIVGAHYYLELRRLLQQEDKKDAQINREDYINLVQVMADDFLAGVQENPRVRLMANPLTNLKMIFSPTYTRTRRIGELYEELIYSRIKDNEGSEKRWLNQLYIYPEGNKTFFPRRDNWARLNKVPELILNATTLNSGHNWQFTASWMGESPATIDTDVDSNDRYRRTDYEEAPEPFKAVRLGSAVGASSCVPGLFEPLILSGLYKDTTIRLVDGGVHDNQGVASLLEQDCTVIISSDATGQLNTENDPGGGVVKPLLRSNSTMMQRVRNSQYQDLKARARSGILKGFAFVHLKQGLESKTVDWLNSDEPQSAQPDPNAFTSYGIRQDLQRLLAGIRTDLDSFSELEAYALMTSGYYAIEPELKKYLQDFPLTEAAKPDWKFLQVAPILQQPEPVGADFEKLKTHLEVAAMTFGKVWKLYQPLKNVLLITGALLVFALLFIWWTHPGWKPFYNVLYQFGNAITINMILSAIAILLIGNIIAAKIGSKEARLFSGLVDYRELPRRFLIGTTVGLFGWIIAFIHLRVFDRLFKSLGKVTE